MNVNTQYFAADKLKATVASVCSAAGSEPAEAELIARRLVDANLAGHDSHGVIRLPRYISNLANGGVFANRHVTVVLETSALVVVDGNNGFGQVVGGEAMAIGIEAAKRNGACILALRHSAHLGRIADWAEMAANAGLASFHFVNVTGIGAARVAPFGGSDGRLATNPIAAAIPRPGGAHIVLDMATSIVAEGKVAVAANRGVETPEGWLIDQHGRSTRDPRDLYSDPGGAIMPFGAYKGYGLSLFVDLFAGAMIGAGGITHRHDVAARIENNMVAIIIDPTAMGDRKSFDAEVESIVAYVTASKPAGDEGVLVPGDPERRTRAERLANGIPIEAETWRQIVEAGKSVGVAVAGGAI
jgi:uncharacterized oxidoreductase